jgi:hypothetical protein
MIFSGDEKIHSGGRGLKIFLEMKISIGDGKLRIKTSFLGGDE